MTPRDGYTREWVECLRHDEGSRCDAARGLTPDTERARNGSGSTQCQKWVWVNLVPEMGLGQLNTGSLAVLIRSPGQSATTVSGLSQSQRCKTSQN